MSNSLVISNESNFFMILKSTMDLPGVKINREEFLKQELSKRFSREIVNLAVKENPAYAGITIQEIEKISKSCINYETNKVAVFSFAAGIPGGFAMISTIPADIAQYYGHILRILQKLIYLYGWPALYDSKGNFDDETVNQLILFIGVMFGVNIASGGISKLLESSLKGSSLIKRSPMEKNIYPIVKEVAKKLGYSINRKMFTKSAEKIVPLVGGVISGGLTYVTFRKNALKLEEYLKTLPTADVDSYKNRNKLNLSDKIIEGEIV